MSQETAKHSPGPWLFHPSAVSFTQVECADGTRPGRLAASIYHPVNPRRPMIRVGATTDDDAAEVVANARLIAAAPDLLDALKVVVATLPHMGGSERSTFSLLKRATAAIAKAEGKLS
jgi:hypothetical protein